MPLYEYLCDKCGSKFELIEKFSSVPLTVHEGCGGSVNRLVSAPALQFKGSGWYITDYAKSGSSGDSKRSGEGKSGDSKDSKSGDSKSGDSKSGDSKSGDSKSGDSKSSSSSDSSSSSSSTPSTSSSSSSSSSDSGGSKN